MYNIQLAKIYGCRKINDYHIILQNKHDYMVFTFVSKTQKLFSSPLVVYLFSILSLSIFYVMYSYYILTILLYFINWLMFYIHFNWYNTNNCIALSSFLTPLTNMRDGASSEVLFTFSCHSLFYLLT